MTKAEILRSSSMLNITSLDKQTLNNKKGIQKVSF